MSKVIHVQPEPTDDEADLQMFACEPEGIYRVPVGAHMNPPFMHRAFMRAVVADQIRLIAIEPGLVPGPGGRNQQVMFQVYHRTFMGNMRLAALRAGIKTNMNVKQGE